MRAEPNRIFEEYADKLLVDLETTFNADVLAYCGVIDRGVDDWIRDAVEGIKNKREKLVVLLETPGGSIEVTQRIAETFRHHYPKRVEFVVANAAMSAGTILVMSGDAIHMDYYAVLGPIDPQVERTMPDGTTRWVPALGYLHKYAELVEKSNQGKLSTAEAGLFIQQFDPAELYAFEQARDLSITLLKDWLTRYKFKDWNTTKTRGLNVDMAMRETRAGEIAKTLNDTGRWHTHGRGISIAILRSDLIKLEVDDFGADVTLSKKIRSYHRALTHYMAVMRLALCVHTRGNFEQLGG
jgi:hypothetical protein